MDKVRSVWSYSSFVSETSCILLASVGTIWMQQILIKIMDAAHPDQAEDDTNRVRVPWLEGKSSDDPFRERPDPRVFRSHLPTDMLPDGVKDKQVKVAICNIQAFILFI